MTDLPDVSWCVKGGSREYVVVRSFGWWIGMKDSGWMLEIPVGKEFESSVPWWLKWVFSPDDPFFLKAAAIHDALLEMGTRNLFADSQWIEAAMSDHAPALRTWFAYFGMLLRRFCLWLIWGN